VIIFFCIFLEIILSRHCDEYATKTSCNSTAINFKNLPPCLGHDSKNDSVMFAIIGDYGLNYAFCERHVADLIKKFNTQFGDLDFIMTLGDNNYWDGSCNSFYDNIGSYYSEYYNSGICINPLRTRTLKENRFFPTIGNHDWDAYRRDFDTLPFLQYFNYLKDFEPSFAKGVFYKKTIANGLIDLYSLNSNLGTPTAPPAEKALFVKQMEWLKQDLSTTQSTFKIVYFHHPPYTTAQIDPPATWMTQNFSEWGASIVISGHEHTYERLSKFGIYYVICGLGGHSWLYTIHNCDIEPGSQFRYNSFHGAILAFASPRTIDFCFYSIENQGTLVDSFSIHKNN